MHKVDEITGPLYAKLVKVEHEIIASEKSLKALRAKRRRIVLKIGNINQLKLFNDNKRGAK